MLTFEAYITFVIFRHLFKQRAEGMMMQVADGASAAFRTPTTAEPHENSFVRMCGHLAKQTLEEVRVLMGQR